MDHSPQNLSPDIEWMLLSGQVSAEVLAEALIEEHALDLYSLWFILTGEHSKAWEGLSATLNQALLKSSQYTGVSSGRAWLYQQALSIWRSNPKFNKTPLNHFPWQDLEAGGSADDSLEGLVESTLSEFEARDQLLILLALWQNCSVAEIAQILDLETLKVEHVLGQFKTRIPEQLPGGEYSSTEKMLKGWFTTRAERWREAHPIDDQKAESLLTRVLVSGRARLTRQRLIIRLTESFLVGLVVLAIWGLIQSLDQFFPEVEPTQEIVYATVLVTSTPNGSAARIGPSGGEPVRSIVQPQAGQEALYYTVQAGDDLEAIARKFAGREAEEIIRFNRLVPGQDLEPGQRLLIPPRQDESPFPPATPVPGSGVEPGALVESPPHAPGAPRLFGRYRWNTEGWDTVWVDLVYRDHRQYPQHATAGRERLQVWLSDNQLLTIQGVPEGAPEQVLLAWLDQDQYYQAVLDEQDKRYHPLEADQFASHPILRNYLTRLFNPFYPAMQRGERSFRLVGVETMNGVEVELLEGRNREGWLISRLWIDRDGGLILRSQRFSGDQDERLEDEIRVTRWAYNIDFPQELFDPRFPWRGGFAQDHRGNPEITTMIETLIVVPRLTTPNALRADPSATPLADSSGTPRELSDLSAVSLKLRIPGSPGVNSATFQPVEIYSGNTYLGQIRIGNPNKLICERSPDGSKLAFVNDPESPHKPLTYLHWISLVSKDALAEQSLAGIMIGNFAFAPDSRRVAFFGQDGWRQGLFVYDLIDNRLDFLLELDTAHSLAWRPDGKYILLVGSRGGSLDREQVILVRSSDGQEFYTQPDELVNGDLFNWPELEWGVNFPVEMKGIEGCTS